jgi:hypothetical protein
MCIAIESHPLDRSVVIALISVKEPSEWLTLETDYEGIILNEILTDTPELNASYRRGRSSTTRLTCLHLESMSLPWA